MEALFPKEVRAGLDQARIESMKKASRLRVSVAGKEKPVLRLWKTGFSMETDAPSMRGFVDLYDGSIHLFQCLIVTSHEDSGERHYEFKRATAVTQSPALDFERSEAAPAGLIEDAR